MREVRRISSLAKIRRGASPRPISDPKYFGGEVGWVRIVDVTRSGRRLRSTEEYLSALGESMSVRVRPGDLIMSICGTIGRPIIVDMDACIHDGFVQFYDLTGIETEYLYYSLQFSESALIGKGQPGTQVNLNTNIAGQHEIYCPSLEQQRRIAKLLSLIDTAIERTEALIAKHQQIKAGLMHDLFTRGVLPNGQLRPPRSEAPELYQETALGWIPRDWYVSDCGREFAIDSGITLGPHRRPGRNARPYLRVANVHRDELRLEDLAYLEELAGDADLPLKEKDLLVVEGHANRMEIGRCAMVTEAAVGMLFQNHLFRLRPHSLVSEFALDWLNSHHAQRYWDTTCSTSSGLNTINRKMLGRLPVLVPPADEQARIVRAVAVTKCRIEEEAQLLDKLSKQKLGLMQDLLTGRVPVPAVEPEPVNA